MKAQRTKTMPDRPEEGRIRNIAAARNGEKFLRTSTDQLRDLNARVNSIREEERARIAREIHDELGQALTVLKLELVDIEQTAGAGCVQKKVQSLIGQVDGTIDLVRHIASELRPSILDHFGLKAAIKWQVAQLEKRTGLQIRVKAEDEDESDLPGHIATAAFRVVQEAMTNVIRHAQASAVEIVVDETSTQLRISIMDNGKGMTAQQVSDGKSLGILGMKERLSHLGGRLRIASPAGKGTRLDIVIPIRRN